MMPNWYDDHGHDGVLAQWAHDLEAERTARAQCAEAQGLRLAASGRALGGDRAESTQAPAPQQRTARPRESSAC